MNGNGSHAPESLRCPVCQARFRGASTCSRCGAGLTRLMLLAAHAYSHRQSARRALRAGAAERALAEARAAQQLHATSQGSTLEMVCATAVRNAASPLANRVLNSAARHETESASSSILAHRCPIHRGKLSEIASPLPWKTLCLSATAALVLVAGCVYWNRQRSRT